MTKKLLTSFEKTEKLKNDEKSDENLESNDTQLGSNLIRRCRTTTPECWGSLGILFRLSILMLIGNLIHLLSGWAKGIAQDLPERFRNDWAESQVKVGPAPTEEKKKQKTETTHLDSSKEVPREPKIQAKSIPHREVVSTTYPEDPCNLPKEDPKEPEIVTTGRKIVTEKRIDC